MCCSQGALHGWGRVVNLVSAFCRREIDTSGKFGAACWLCGRLLFDGALMEALHLGTGGDA